eukprot:sb/3465325/
MLGNLKLVPYHESDYHSTSLVAGDSVVIILSEYWPDPILISLKARENSDQSIGLTVISLTKPLIYLLDTHYNRCASLSQFIIHRGLIISVMQAIFSAVFFFVSISLYQGILLIGYSTFFTMGPVFFLVLDVDVDAKIAMTYPELYKELQKGRVLSFKTFFVWILISIYQGTAIMYLGILLFKEDFIHVLAITFTVLIVTELLMVVITVRTWHWAMAVAQSIGLTLFSFLSKRVRTVIRALASHYNRCASLSQFIIHRGLIISVMQAIFSAVFFFVSISLYQGILLIGYSTFFTMGPVFFLVLDVDVDAKIAMTYPELYKELQKGRVLSFKTFFVWILISIYQGTAIMYLGILLFKEDFIHVLAITFTVLIVTELLMVVITVRTWHWAMAVAQVTMPIYGLM